MSDDLVVGGRSYISSKRAAELCSYSQDYIGQLARAGLIDAKRIGGLWYVSLESLNTYKTEADTYKPEPPQNAPVSEPDSIVTLEGKDYISANRAAKLTGYNQDYVGQLARSGQIFARQVANRWYIDRRAILAHKAQKDALLAEVQVESVGLRKDRAEPVAYHAEPQREELLNYSVDVRDLLPQPIRPEVSIIQITKPLEVTAIPSENTESTNIPIRVVAKPLPTSRRPKQLHDLSRSKQVSIPDKTIFRVSIAGAALTIVVVFSIGLASLKSQSIYASASRNIGVAAVGEVMSSAASGIGDMLETLLTKELLYIRAE